MSLYNIAILALSGVFRSSLNSCTSTLTASTRPLLAAWCSAVLPSYSHRCSRDIHDHVIEVPLSYCTSCTSSKHLHMTHSYKCCMMYGHAQLSYGELRSLTVTLTPLTLSLQSGGHLNSVTRALIASM